MSVCLFCIFISFVYTCRCCWSCCCSSCSLSVSNTTGRTRIMNEVVPTQSAEREKLKSRYGLTRLVNKSFVFPHTSNGKLLSKHKYHLYSFLARVKEHCADASAAQRSDSGNISVSPHSLSNSVSSSYREEDKSVSYVTVDRRFARHDNLDNCMFV